MIQTIETGNYVAHLHPMSGEGVLVCPNPSRNVWLGAESVHEADWNAMIRRLDAVGYELSDDERGHAPVECGQTRDGRAIVGLFGRDPIVTDPPLDLIAAGSQALMLRARVTS
ncbi:hypothetical protein NSZ01_05210 [Nocardioides szechwanensis]|uniref:Uncharacterized protein n=1 Tax=Nocardioides szechwanensis TaxID=1005944 RepID=A0A1G9W412_9ACTN|nr:hypothetical protein [Nocardioides szechwanensis]GEP32753.1 hypothetical protein NSZ01_05210 [Nocardioides szechwanensis]SDM79230.1 hypothetical protein SAMN05192576_0941 [Nocardioides szechwanensis]